MFEGLVELDEPDELLDDACAPDVPRDSTDADGEDDE